MKLALSSKHDILTTGSSKIVLIPMRAVTGNASMLLKAFVSVALCLPLSPSS